MVGRHARARTDGARPVGRAGPVFGDVIGTDDRHGQARVGRCQGHGHIEGGGERRETVARTGRQADQGRTGRERIGPPAHLIEHLAAGHFKTADTGDDVEDRLARAGVTRVRATLDHAHAAEFQHLQDAIARPGDHHVAFPETSAFDE